jgi:hypothetical protein
MKMSSAALKAFWKYAWLTYRRDALWFPPAIWALFVVIVSIMRHPAVRFNIARGYLGFIVPLISGIMAAYALLDDPALELRFATPVRAGQTLLAPLGLIVAVQTACALSFQLFLLAIQVDLSPLGGLLGVQLAWLLPALSLIALGTAGSLASAQSSLGAFLVGAVWLVQIMMKSWLEANAKYLHLFLAVLVPRDPDLALNQCVLLAGSVVLLSFSWALLHRQERFL